MANVDATVEKNGTKQVSDDTDVVQNIFRVFLHIIRVILEILFYPFIWIGKEFVRMWKFLGGGKANKDKPLSHSEIAFVESVPIFLTVLGTLIAIFIGIIAWIGFSETLRNFFNDLSKGFEGILNILRGVWSGLVALGTFLIGLVIGFLEFLGEILSFLINDTLTLLVVLAGLTLILIILYIVLSETDYVTRILKKIGYVGLGITDLPRWVYDLLDRFWLRISKGVGRRIVGGDSVIKKKRSFYQRIIWLVLLYAIWAFLWGILFLLGDIVGNDELTDTTTNTEILNVLGSLFIILFVSGIISGFLLLFILVFTLNKASGKKYEADQMLIDKVRHESLIDFFVKKKKYEVLNLSDVSIMTDILQDDFKRHWTDKKLSIWKLYSKHVVNQSDFDEKLKKIDELEKKGLNVKC
jgi:hypothetical protein